MSTISANRTIPQAEKPAWFLLLFHREKCTTQQRAGNKETSIYHALKYKWIENESLNTMVSDVSFSMKRRHKNLNIRAHTLHFDCSSLLVGMRPWKEGSLKRDRAGRIPSDLAFSSIWWVCAPGIRGTTAEAWQGAYPPIWLFLALGGYAPGPKGRFQLFPCHKRQISAISLP